MDTAYVWTKTAHLVFVMAWMGGVFYLPRILVNLAMVSPDSHAERERLLLMARKLNRFAGGLMVLSIVLGLVLWLGYGVGAGSGWMHAKLLLVVATIGFHHACGRLLRRFEALQNTRSHRWYRVFNEVSVLLFTAIVALVVVKPF